MTTNYGSREWFAHITEDEFRAFVDHIRREFNTIFAEKNLGWQKDYKDTKRYLSDFLNLVEQTDMSVPSNNKKVHKLVMGRFNHILTKASRYTAVNQSNDVASNYIMRKSRQLHKLMDHQRKSSLARNSYNMLENFAPPAVVIALPLAFDTKTGFAAIDVLLGDIQKSLSTLKDMKLADEDQFLVEKAENEYIPQLVAAALSLKSAPEQQQRVAEEDFGTQLTLLSERLSTIIQESVRSTLMEVRSQTQFFTTALVEPKKELTR